MSIEVGRAMDSEKLECQYLVCRILGLVEFYRRKKILFDEMAGTGLEDVEICGVNLGQISRENIQNLPVEILRVLYKELSEPISEREKKRKLLVAKIVFAVALAASIVMVASPSNCSDEEPSDAKARKGLIIP